MDTTDLIDYVMKLPDRRLTAEGKYVLIHVLQKFGDGVVDAQVKELSGQLGMTDKVFKQARDLLIELDYLTRVQRRHDEKLGAGRPKISFKISQSLIDEFNVFCADNFRADPHKRLHQTRINKLLFVIPNASNFKDFIVNEVGKKIPKRQSGNLTPANRLLLAILYSHADECGAARDLGFSTLAGLAGMTSTRLDTQLGKLSDMGYVLARVSGVTGRHLFGRSSGAFFLNVFNDDLGSDIDSAVLVLMQTDYVDHYNNCYWGERFYLNAQIGGRLFSASHQSEFELAGDFEKKIAEIRSLFLGQKLFEDDCIRKTDEVSGLFTYIIFESAFGWTSNFQCFNLQSFFKDVPLPIFSNFLQYKINEYASSILSRCWNDIGMSPISIQEEIVEQIKNEIYPLSLRKKSSDLRGAQLIAEALGLFVYRVSFEIALQAKWVIQNAFKDKDAILQRLNKAWYTILPVTYQRRWANKFSVAVKLDGTYNEARFIAIKINKKQKNESFILKNSYSTDKCTKRDELLQSFGYGVKSV